MPIATSWAQPQAFLDQVGSPIGLAVKLETEEGKPLEVVYDPHNLLHKILPTEDDTSFVCLRFIDWYGDTVFNRIQMKTFLSEWQRLYRPELSAKEIGMLNQVRELAERSRDNPHYYLKFYGD